MIKIATRICLLTTLFTLTFAAHAEQSAATAKVESKTPLAQAQLQYFGNLFSLCGARFEGEMTFPESGQDSFAGKLLVATFAKCSNQEIRIPFHVGENTSRTWILRKTASGIELKHDHRHADGTPDEVTLYGGTTTTEGSETSQSFPADAYTAKLIPDAATNVWSISLNEDSTMLTYHLTRHDKPRFTAVLQRVTPPAK